MESFAKTSRRAFVAAAIAITGSAGVWSVGESAQAQSLALVQINQQALFFNQLNDGAAAAAKAAGAELVVFNANNDPTAQNNAVETYIAQGVDGIIVVAIDTNGIMPAVIQAANAGIAVVAVDAILGDGPHVSQVGVNNYGAGQDIGNVFLEFVDAKMDGSAKIGIVGALNSTIQNVRQKGFEDTIATNANIEVVGVVDGRNVQDNALTAAENLMTANPDMQAIYATGEPALVGAVAAVISQSAEDRIKIFGWDLTAQVIDGIDQGFVEAVVQQDPAGMGAAAVEALLAVIKGGSVSRVTDVPITIVTQDNVESFRATFK